MIRIRVQLERPQGEIRGRGSDISVYCNSTKGHCRDSSSSTAKNNTQIRLTSSGTVRPLIFCWGKKTKEKKRKQRSAGYLEEGDISLE